MEGGQSEVRERSERGQREIRERSETGQREIRDRSARGQRQVRERSEAVYFYELIKKFQNTPPRLHTVLLNTC